MCFSFNSKAAFIEASKRIETEGFQGYTTRSIKRKKIVPLGEATKDGDEQTFEAEDFVRSNPTFADSNSGSLDSIPAMIAAEEEGEATTMEEKPIKLKFHRQLSTKVRVRAAEEGAMSSDAVTDDVEIFADHDELFA
jgi:hypothetical protein